MLIPFGPMFSLSIPAHHWLVRFVNMPSNLRIVAQALGISGPRTETNAAVVHHQDKDAVLKAR